ncbi:Cytochrome c oxidase polypeptide 5, mitochondrial [Colletotrichum chlorophyti]|uniref:Cytochrome c oxidase polypeptide V n=1 Tax=Colletotrichum chlorophyti TaxID=708187 RepID=A0A1Q8R9D3_9PEZI|nr:Cytochrome c oxidase polypeptide 5, mitochondrial [Colletotrichum chlorophyti]
MLRTPTVSLARTGLRAASAQQSIIRRAATTHAISNPTLANIEKRWEGMPPQEQAELWMALKDRMKGPWSELTLQEKKAAYWIAFGPHGPRTGTPPGEGARVFWGVIASVGASLAIFATIRAFANPPPDTMTKEYQEASNEFLKSQNSDPITGIASEGYSGKGMVQSPPKGH